MLIRITGGDIDCIIERDVARIYHRVVDGRVAYIGAEIPHNKLPLSLIHFLDKIEGVIITDIL